MNTTETTTEKTYYRTLKGSHRHLSWYCANYHRSIFSGDTMIMAPAEVDTYEPCSKCTAEELANWNPAPTKVMCPNSGIAHPGRGRLYDDCKDCGRNGAVNRSTGRIRAHQPKTN